MCQYCLPIPAGFVGDLVFRQISVDHFMLFVIEQNGDSMFPCCMGLGNTMFLDGFHDCKCTCEKAYLKEKDYVCAYEEEYFPLREGERGRGDSSCFLSAAGLHHLVCQLALASL